ncbi:MAG: T9SS type A sorting domain-containing protein [Bacteroidetes bacterium]|nr:T9SS type A sorting domain-containing protein [Bacteroidota bacterium]
MKNTLFSALTILFVFCFFAPSAQVQFKLTYQEMEGNYLVSIVSSETWASPYNLTGTGQITMKVPSGKFEPVNVINLQEGVQWSFNARSNNPEEAPSFDYLSLGLLTIGTKDLTYEAGEELPLLTFENKFGCTGPIYLMDNQQDPFLPPNSKNVNVGNQLSILGAGGNAYTGNISSGVFCESKTTSAEDLFTREDMGLSIYPNPFSSFLKIGFNWQKASERANIVIYDNRGTQVFSYAVELNPGLNSYRLKPGAIPSGVYWMTLEGADWQIELDTVVKVLP